MSVFSHNPTALNSRLSFGRWAFLLQLVLILAAGSTGWAAGCTPAPAGLVAWWPGDGNANDIVGTNNGILMNGTTAAGYVGSAFKFDGTNNFVQFPDSPVFHPANFTIEAWVRFDSLDSPSVGGSPPGQSYIIYKHNSRPSGEQEAFNLSKDRNHIATPGDTFCFEVSSASGLLVYLESSTLIATGVWYHVAGVRGPNFIQLFINGQLESQTNVNFPQDYGSQPLLFGTSGISYWDHRFHGMLDEVSLYNRVLSSNEIAAIYADGSAGKCHPSPTPAITSQPTNQTVFVGGNATFNVTASGTQPLSCQWNFNGTKIVGATVTALTLANVQLNQAGNYTVLVTNAYGSVTSSNAVLTVISSGSSIPAPAGLVAWWPGEGNANDMAGTNNGSLMGGATANGAGYVGQAFQLDGTNGYMQIPDSPVFHPTNFTIEAWVRFDSLDSPSVSGSPPGQSYIIFKHNSQISGEQVAFNLSKERNITSVPGDTFIFEVSTASPQFAYLASATLISAGVWYHIAGVRGSNYLQLYINGQLEGQTNVNFPQDYGSQPLLFGTSGISYWDHKFDGELDEVALYNRVLSSNEIAAIYASGNAGKCKAPTLLVQPAGQTCYWGGSVTLTSAVAGVNPLVYHWQDNGSAIPAATNSTLILTNLQLTNAGNYAVLVTNVDGSVISSPALLRVKVDDVSFKLVSLGGNRKGAALTVSGVSNKTYGVQYSTNLVRWIGLTNLTLTAPTNVWQDPIAATQAVRFYRVGQGPISIP